MENLIFEVQVAVDQDEVVDGRLLAMSLIHRTYAMLIPYVGGCPACCDQLFTVLANRVIDRIHDEGKPQGVVLHLGAEEVRTAAISAHLEREHGNTAAMLGQDATCH